MYVYRGGNSFLRTFPVVTGIKIKLQLKTEDFFFGLSCGMSDQELTTELKSLFIHFQGIVELFHFVHSALVLTVVLVVMSSKQSR